MVVVKEEKGEEGEITEMVVEEEKGEMEEEEEEKRTPLLYVLPPMNCALQ